MAKNNNDLVKNIDEVREFMQYFYIYGFYTMEGLAEVTGKATRTFSEYRMYFENWMGEYYGYHTNNRRKSYFITFDSRNVRRNPLYTGWKMMSFTPNDILMHFLILDVLHDGREYSVQEVLDGCAERLGNEQLPEKEYSDGVVTNKLSDYAEMGVLNTRKEGRTRYYSMAPCADVKPLAALLAFFSEVADCGVVGSFLEDRLETPCEAFRMKHHYIAQTFDAGLMVTLLEAMHADQDVIVYHRGKRNKNGQEQEGTKRREVAYTQQTVTPLHIMRSAQDGRTYLLAVSRKTRAFESWRLDHIVDVKPARPAKGVREDRLSVAEMRQAWQQTRQNRWGASMQGCKKPKCISFTICVVRSDDLPRYQQDPTAACHREEHLVRRMYRECRTGRVEEVNNGNCLRFTAELYDLREILPWVRTFIGHITEFRCDDEAIPLRFEDDLYEMADLYEGEPAAQEEVQA